MTGEKIGSGLKKYEIIAPPISDDPEAVQKRRLRKEKCRGWEYNEQALK